MGVSPDPSDRQKQFDEANDLGFPLLADTDRKVAKLFGAARFWRLPVKRVTFVVGADREVKAIIKSEANMEKHADEALAAVRELTTA